DWSSRIAPDMSMFLQTCGYRFGFLCHFRYDNPKAVRHNSGFQGDEIEASPKKYIQAVNPNLVSCYGQNCLSYFFNYELRFGNLYLFNIQYHCQVVKIFSIVFEEVFNNSVFFKSHFSIKI